jgi:dienelactone hydrolase
MAIQEIYVDYEVSGSIHQAFVAWDDVRSGPRPGIMVGHAWGGRTEFEESKARGLAQQGYVGVAIDMYGKGIRGSSPEAGGASDTYDSGSGRGAFIENC